MSPLRRFLIESKSQWGWLALLILALITAAIFEVSAPVLLGKVVDAIVSGLQTDQDINTIFTSIDTIILWLIAIYSGHALFTYFGEYVMASIGSKTVLALRTRMSTHLYSLPIEYFHDHQRGDLLSRLTSDLDTVAETIGRGVPGLVSAIIGIIGATAMMLWISPILGASIIGIILVGIVCLTWLSKRARRVYLRNQNALGAFNSGIEEIVVGKPIIQTFSLEDTTTNQAQVLNENLFKSMRSAAFTSQLVEPLVKFLNQFTYCLVAIQGGLMVLRGSISIGDIQAFFLYVGQVSDPLSRSSYILTKFQETSAALGRIYEVIDTPSEIDKGNKTLGDTTTHPGTIDFEHVDFGYTPSNVFMKDINIHIPGGSMVAIVGPTGAGKSTLVNLIMRFYDIINGRITIDGIDIRDVSRESLHNTVGMVLQDAWIFTGTIADNIGYGKPNASREEIEYVAKLAMADHFIRTLPDGYDTVLKRGGDDLSQGQRQLITIARAFLADPTILILDEATANVDTRTEVEVQKAMNTLLKGRTSIVIAHRLSTIKNADFLLVVENGTIVEQGTHHELIERGGHYKELYENYAAGMTL
ncbi:ABC transporter, ATP-binding protein [Veillonella dispar ATCC 17748]|uniref:ABC transporter, ATP-binding protein n=1 Tax=Veillonella dispar ATCC 17748 TaxID=546273 RepID=C4FSC4_9FIRM|nr:MULTISPECIES: ABC transporter ATP-binding protein [Veillonella]EEP64752.1 ABC transporter, ATP-binding protein [Veillonella dispar ATCC 17748]MBS6293655.1 ABC transporter ATP-binding protein [Veillonella sp.]VEG92845.1 Lipid A export ATP-binding/permease protein MsbA [Veillonella dispar]